MAAKLSSNLQPASFRGVGFQVETADLGAGRRTQLHEYPQRDKPYIEDLGRAAREVVFDGFLVGADYVDQANKLLAALEAPGSGTLVHPWFGTLTVSINEQARVSFSAALGLARVSMSFVESGELAFPAAGNATQAQSRFAAGDLEFAAIDDFADVFTIDGFQDFVADAAGVDLAGIFDTVIAGGIPGLDVLGYAGKAQSVLSTALGLLGSPSALATAVAGWLGVSSLVNSGATLWTSGQRVAALVRALIALAEDDEFDEPPAAAVWTPSRAQQTTNTSALNALTRRVVLAQAVGVSSLLPIANPASRARPSVAGGASGSSVTAVATAAAGAIAHDDITALRNDLAAALDAESLTAPDAVYVALMDARGKVWQDLTERARDSARLTTLTPAETTPALVLAYEFYGDATRDADLVARNGIHHPGFVPVQPLKVLTR